MSETGQKASSNFRESDHKRELDGEPITVERSLETGRGPSLSDARIVIPTLNAERHLDDLLAALAVQGVASSQVTCIDSASDDDTVRRFEEFGAEVLQIERWEFDHGGSRQLAVDAHPEAAIFVMMTQDAVPAAGAVQLLLEAFADPAVAIAYGRQMPRSEAGPIERFARMHNYSDRSEVRVLEDAKFHGVRTVFCSNSFCAWRADALAEVGGFPSPVHFGEDQVAAGRLLEAGHRLCYVSDARVVHSHGYGFAEDLHRYFDVGALHGRNPWLRERFGIAERDGARFVVEEARYLLRVAPWLLPSAWYRTLLKYIGYRLGQLEPLMPRNLVVRLSSQPYFWQRRREGDARSE